MKTCTDGKVDGVGRGGGGGGVEGWVMVGASGYFVNRCVHVWVCGFVLYV